MQGKNKGANANAWRKKLESAFTRNAYVFPDDPSHILGYWTGRSLGQARGNAFLITGLTSDCSFYLDVMSDIRKNNFNVHGYDLYGQGASLHTRERDGKNIFPALPISLHSEHLRSFFNHAALDQTNLPNVTIAHSLGALIFLNYLLDWHEKNPHQKPPFSKAVLVTPFLALKPGFYKTLLGIVPPEIIKNVSLSDFPTDAVEFFRRFTRKELRSYLQEQCEGREDELEMLRDRFDFEIGILHEAKKAQQRIMDNLHIFRDMDIEFTCIEATMEDLVCNDAIKQFATDINAHVETIEGMHGLPYDPNPDVKRRLADVIRCVSHDIGTGFIRIPPPDNDGMDKDNQDGYNHLVA